MELKPCPFCGGEALIWQVNEKLKSVRIPDGKGGVDYAKGLSYTWRVICKRCSASGSNYEDCIFREKSGRIVMTKDGLGKAIEAWNRRASNESNEKVMNENGPQT